VEVPKLVYRDAPVDHVIPHDVTVNNLIPHDVPIDIPRIVAAPASPPVAAKPAPPKPVSGPDSPYAARTPDERKFADQPEYKTAKYHGRIVKSRDGHELSFEDGMDFHPGHWDDATREIVWDPTNVILSDEFVGDLGMCVPQKGHAGMWDCTALHNGQVVVVTGDQKSSTGPATEMVAVDIKVGGYPVEGWSTPAARGRWRFRKSTPMR
jgi:hypothetical protein